MESVTTAIVRALPVGVLAVALAQACSGRAGIRPVSPTTPEGASLEAAPRLVLEPDGDVTPGQAHMMRALVTLRAGRGAEALAHWQQALAEYPGLRDYHLYYLALSSANAGDADAARVHLSTLVETDAASVLAPSAALHLGRLTAAGDPLAAMGWLRVARAGTARGSPEWTKASLLLAALESEHGSAEGAHRLVQEVRATVGPGVARRRARRAARRLESLHPEVGPRAPARAIAEARLLLREGDAAESERVVRAALASGEAGKVNAHLLEVLAQAQYDRGRVDSAEETLERLISKNPHSPAAAEALLTLGTWRWNRDDDAVALARFSDFLRRYPRHSRASDALYAIGRIHQAAGRDDEARRTFAGLADRHPHAKMAPEARWRQGWLDYAAGRHGAAAAAFGRLADGDPSAWVRESARYWQARAVEHEGGLDAARPVYRAVVEEFPRGYYAVWAERWLASHRAGASGARGTAGGEDAREGWRADATRAGDEDLDPSAFPRPLGRLAAAPGAAGLDAERFGRATDLATMGLRRHAERELDAIPFPPPSEPAARLVLLEAYARVGRHDRALMIPNLMLSRREHLPGGTIDRFLFPRGYWKEIRHHATARGIDPYLVAALIRQESRFSPEAVSPVGARGLMQLMPATANRLARQAGRPEPTARELERPEVNIEHGTAYLRELFDRYDAALDRILAAYNAGEDAVAKWERRFPGVAADEFVERISYRETREFVKAVLRNYRVYRALYGDGETPAVRAGRDDPAAPGPG
jgi:soluble lytic murein transglycosylase